MSCDQVTIKGTFKDRKERYEEIQKTLEEGLSRYIDPEEGWGAAFVVKDKCLELYIDNAWGNWGYAQNYISKEFINAYLDVELEFDCTEYYGDEISGETLTYSNGKQKVTSHYEVDDEFCDDDEENEDEDE